MNNETFFYCTVFTVPEHTIVVLRRFNPTSANKLEDSLQ